SPAFWSNHSRRAAPSNPGTGTQAITLQIPNTSRVKMMRDFSSGILKQFANVLAMAAIMWWAGYWRILGLGLSSNLTSSAFGLDLLPGGSAESTGSDEKLLFEFPCSEDLNSIGRPIGETN